MQLSAKTQNAFLALLELARKFDSPEPVCLKAIAEMHGLSPQFLVQVLQQLRRAGLVRSTRGASGGYRLAKAPESICLLDVVLAIDGPPVAPAITSDHELAVVLRHRWSALVDAFQSGLAQTTLRQLVEEAGQRTSNDMYYI